MARIDYWHTEMPYLGTCKMVRQLQKEGHVVGRKLVRRLMAQMGIHALYPKVNLSKRNFSDCPLFAEKQVCFLAKSSVVH